MKSIVLISQRPLDLTVLAKVYREIGTARVESVDRLVVEDGNRHFFIDLDRKVEREFDKSEIEHIHQAIPDPSFAVLEYNDDKLVDKALEILPDQTVAMIDNDHGLIAEVTEIIRRIKSGVRWQETAH